MNAVDIALTMGKIAIVLGFFLNLAALGVWADRRQGAMVQDRVGPDRAVIYLPNMVARMIVLGPPALFGVLSMYLALGTVAPRVALERTTVNIQIGVFVAWLSLLVLCVTVQRGGAINKLEEIFDDDYLHTLPFMTPQQTEREVAFLLEALQLPQGGRVLDIGCGYGRHAMEIAARGYKTVGLDLSLPLLIRATDAARRVGVNVDFVHGDMRDMTFDAEFEGAYCYFTTFGYFDDDTNRRVAAGICRSLKPGGRFVLDLINRDYLVGDLPTRVWWQGDGCVVLEEVDFNYFTSRLQVQRQIILEDGRQLEQEISIRAYSLHEIGKVLHHAGFRVLEVSGGLDLRGRFYGNESRQLLVVAEKKSEPSALP